MFKAPIRFETGLATHVGRIRTNNEDSALAQDAAGVWAVADGMGGHEGGEFASASIVAALKEMPAADSAADLLNRCAEAAIKANTQIRLSGQEGSIAGTTLVALLTHGTDFACVWAGDSRLYLIRGGTIEQWTEDHTEVQELLSSGAITAAQAVTWPRRNVVTRALGVFETPQLDIRQGALRGGDIFVLCSDGLTNLVPDAEIRQHCAAPAQEAADALVALTLERGAPDNVTVIVVRCLAVREPTVVLPLLATAPSPEPAP